VILIRIAWPAHKRAFLSMLSISDPDAFHVATAAHRIGFRSIAKLLDFGEQFRAVPQDGCMQSGLLQQSKAEIRSGKIGIAEVSMQR